MPTRSPFRFFTEMIIPLLVLTACGGANVSGKTSHIDGLDPWPRPNQAEFIVPKDVFQQAQIEDHPGIRLDTAYWEVAITGQPYPMSVMVTFTTDIK